MLLFNHLYMNLCFRKAIFLYLLIISFSLFSENGFAASAKERCEAEWVNASLLQCIAWVEYCLALNISPEEKAHCRRDNCGGEKCLPLNNTACKHFFGAYKDMPYTGTEYKFYDEECIEPNPEETPPDPLENQLNLDEVSSPNISFPNECRGE